MIQQSEIKNISKYKLDNNGAEEIIMKFSTHVRTDHGEGSDRIQRGYQIWDIDNLQFVTLISYERFENWPYGGGMVATNSGIVRYFEKKISFEKDRIVIKSKNQETGKFGSSIRYKYRNGSLLKLK